jgi:tRNA U55 pseudouridine synthase TruB
MLELRRTKAGIFEEEFAVNLYEFEKAVEEYRKGNQELLEKIIVPAESAIKKVYPIVQIKAENLKQIFTGKPIYKKDVLKDEGWKIESTVSVFCGEQFVGMYKIFRGKEIFAKPEFVFQTIGK